MLTNENDLKHFAHNGPLCVMLGGDQFSRYERQNRSAFRDVSHSRVSLRRATGTQRPGSRESVIATGFR